MLEDVNGGGRDRHEKKAQTESPRTSSKTEQRSAVEQGSFFSGKGGFFAKGEKLEGGEQIWVK